MKIIFVILLFLKAVTSYSQIPNIDINIYDVQITEKTVSFQYTIKNESDIPVWFHKHTGTIRCSIIDNTLFIAPVYNYFPRPFGVPNFIPYFYIETILINPKSTITVNFNDTQIGTIVQRYNPQTGSLTSGNIFYDYSVANYIDLTLVLTLTNVENPMTDEQYRFFLAENAILVNRLFEVR